MLFFVRPIITALIMALVGAFAAPAPGNAAPTQSHESGASALVDPELLDNIAAAPDEPLHVVAFLSDRADLAGVAGNPGLVVQSLQSAATTSQDAFEAALADQETTRSVGIVNRFWLTNAVLLELPADDSEGLRIQLRAVAAAPGVERLAPNFEIEVVEPEEGELLTDEGDTTWGIDRIRADAVHDEFNVDGAGVRVATLDSGVDIAHPDLADKMWTDDPADPTYPGGWMEFDGLGNMVESQPHDSGNHGTHVGGTIHGGDASGTQIGVAPGAEMMHGQVLYGNNGTWAQVIAGMQWVVAPTDAAGQPAGQPADIVNMSLGASGFLQEMIEPTRAMRAAGIVPMFAIGNNCRVGETQSPGNVYEAMALGATTIDETVAGFSCGGIVEQSDWPSAPANWPEEYVKPDLSAPGADVLSSVPGDAYASMNGTSMATPHASGTAALMLEVNPGLHADELLDLLELTAVWDNNYADAPPDTRFGHGRLDAYEAVNVASANSGISGVVTDSESGEPIEGATVTTGGDGISPTTNADGVYTLRAAPGTYDITITAFAYDDKTVENIEVIDGQFTTADTQLELGPTGSVNGEVAYGLTGVEVPGVEIDVLHTPLEASTSASGSFELENVPAGTYTVEAAADGFPFPEPQEIAVTEGTKTEVDFTLEPPLDIGMITTSNMESLERYLAGFGVDLTRYGSTPEDPGYGHVAAAGHRVVLYGHWYNFMHPGQEVFDQFIADTDNDGIGVVFLGNSLGDNGIAALRRFTGQPESQGSTGEGGGAPAYYTVTDSHPVVEGFEIGDEILTDIEQPNAWYGWFEGWSGNGRSVIADVDRSDGLGGGQGIGVQQRDNNRHVLLADHQPSANRNLPENWSADSERVFWNTIDWVAQEPDPGAPLIVGWDFELDTEEVHSGEEVTVSASVTNVGGAPATEELVLAVNDEPEATHELDLSPGDSEHLTWTITREEFGSFDVEVAGQTGTFRVRPPRVELDVETLADENGSTVPLAGATVYLSQGDLVEVGTTDPAGSLTFETTAADAEYTVIVHRDGTGDEPGYLLQRPVRIDDDTTLTMAPRTLADMPQARSAWNQSATVERNVTAVHDDHQVHTYLRSELTAPHGFAFTAEEVIATVGTYDARHLHSINLMERDWWYVSDISESLAYLDPTGYTQDIAGPAGAAVEVTTNGTEFTAEWVVTDTAGTPFTTVHRGDLRPFTASGAVTGVLEDIPDEIADIAPAASEVLMTLADPSGSAVHRGGVAWDERQVTRDLSDLIGGPPQPGEYTVEVSTDIGPYAPGTVSDVTSLSVGPDSRCIANPLCAHAGAAPLVPSSP